ncbi:helix-turn-helix domain-containing protein [Paenibacillus amylolyticus]|uniref:helix-turn-helix domain-containing protein n=1 Tax=Paenibacillus amylolyticus TaxID=1451 RepID=UPI003EB72F64
MRASTYGVVKDVENESYWLAADLFERGLNASAITTYLAVMKLLSDGRTEFPLQDDIVKLTKQSRKTVVVSLQALEDCGILFYVYTKRNRATA